MHGMLAWWSFDDGEGTTVKDNLDRHPGELINFDGSEWEGGQVNGSLHFNANNQNNQYMLAPPFEIGGAFSVSVWVQYDAFENWSRIIDFGFASNNHNLILANPGRNTQSAFEIRIGGTNRGLRSPNNFWEQNSCPVATVTEGVSCAPIRMVSRWQKTLMVMLPLSKPEQGNTLAAPTGVVTGISEDIWMN